MTIRQQTYNPNTILYAADIQATADNGVVEVSAVVELDQVGSEVNLVFCKEDYNVYKRIAEGLGAVGDVWEVFSGASGGGYNEATGGIENIVENYNATGQRWKTHTFEKDTLPATLEVIAGDHLFSVCVVAGGNGAGYFDGKITAGGEVLEDNIQLFTGTANVVVGDGGFNSDPGKDGVGQPSVFAGLTATAGKTTSPVETTITGTTEKFGGNGNTSGTRGRGSIGRPGTGTKGQPGIVVVAYPVGETGDAFRTTDESGEITQLHRKLPVLPEEVVEDV